MKHFVIKFAAMILCGALLLSAASQHDVQSELSEKVVRLHILAENDSEEAQVLKLKVRDAILTQYGDTLTKIQDKSQAISALEKLLPEIVETAQQVTALEGSSEQVTASLEQTYFPVKTYGDYTFPAGFYDALRLEIEEGNGENWWCVVYPPLCFSDFCASPMPESSEELLKSQLTSRTYRAISLPDQPVIGFKIVEIFRNLWEEISSL